MREANVLALENSMARYVRSTMLAGGEAAAFALIEPSAGVKSFVRLVEIPGECGFVLRAFPSYRNDRLRKRLAVERIISEHNLPAPRVKSYRKGIPFVRPGLLAEERLIGRHLEKGEWTAEPARALADALSAFHHVHSNRFGPIQRPFGKAFGRFWSQRVRNRIEEIRRGVTDDAVRNHLKKAAEWFEAWRSQIQAINRFDLIHEQLNPGNVLVLDEGQHVALLDFETLQYGCRVKDLAGVRHGVFFDDESAWGEFYEKYCTYWDAEEIAQADRLLPFFSAYHHLSAMAVLCKRKARRKDLSPMTSKFKRRAAALESVISR